MYPSAKALFSLTICVVFFAFLFAQSRVPPQKSPEIKASIATSSTFAGVGMPDLRFGGTWSYFGGPEDLNAIREIQGYAGGTGLAAIDDARFLPDGYILPLNDPRVLEAKARAASRGYTNGIKLIGRLNPESFYIAMRWPIPYQNIRNGKARGLVTNTRTGKSIEVAIVDWGPSVKTGKDADLSLGIIAALELQAKDRISFAYVIK